MATENRAKNFLFFRGRSVCIRGKRRERPAERNSHQEKAMSQTQFSTITGPTLRGPEENNDCSVFAFRFNSFTGIKALVIHFKKTPDTDSRITTRYSRKTIPSPIRSTRRASITSRIISSSTAPCRQPWKEIRQESWSFRKGSHRRKPYQQACRQTQEERPFSYGVSVFLP